jgi:RNase P protein component
VSRRIVWWVIGKAVQRDRAGHHHREIRQIVSVNAEQAQSYLVIVNVSSSAILL